MHLEEIEVVHSRVLEELTETCDVNVVVAVQIEIAGQLIVQSISNQNAVIVENISEDRDLDFGLA